MLPRLQFVAIFGLKGHIFSAQLAISESKPLIYTSFSGLR